MEFGEEENAELNNRLRDVLKDNNLVNALLANEKRKTADLEQKLEQTEKDLADYQFNYPTIKELQKENAELKKVAEFQQSSNMSRHFEIKNLKEGLAVGSMWNKHLNSLNKELEEDRDRYRNMVFDKDEHLTKAKEHIQTLISCLIDWVQEGDKDYCHIADAEQFLKENE